MPNEPERKPRCVVCHASYGRGERFCPLDGGAIVDERGADAAEDARLGKTIDGRYLVRRLLGRGGMGAVYLADHIGLDKRVAIKFVTNPGADRDARARFRQEARAAGKIEHENVVQVFDVGVDGEGLDYIVMEYVDGRDLQSVLRTDGALEPARAIAIACQMLRGLHASHAVGIVHRDIKPANVLLAGADEIVKIMDFGIAKSVHAHVAQTDTGTGRVIGTPQYMAPEQLSDAPTDPRTDVYAVGATLYAMLAGEAPHAGTSFTQRIEALARPAPSLASARPELPRALIAAVARALAASPGDRFPDALAFADALGDVASAETTTRSASAEAATREDRPRSAGEVTSSTAATRAAPAPRARWLRPVLGAAIVAIAVGAIALYLVTKRGGTPPPADAAVAVTPPAIDKLALARGAEQRGELALAIAAYQEVYAASPGADPLYRIADLYERIGDRARAATYLHRYLEAAPHASDRELVLERITRLEAVAAAPADAGVDASGPDAAVRTAPPPPKATGDVCECLIVTANGSTTNACTAKLRAPRCRCRDADRNDLCRSPLTSVSSGGALLPDGSKEGMYYCVDRTRAACTPGNDMPATCTVWDTSGGETGQLCRGFGQGQRPSDAPLAGTFSCDMCDWSGKFRGKARDACTGFAGSDGKRYTGELGTCRPR
ncbi:MAG: protein kinase [Myxococcales bacterium]|nr:protein kinase [Myxococcales bacterium]